MDQERLQKIIDAYFDAKKKIFELEGEFAAVAISSTKWRENLRHAFDHLMTGLKFGGDPAKKEEEEMHLTEALSHVKNLPLDGYEHLAGSFLTRSRLKIEKAGLLGTIGEARELHKKAISNYNKGRELRTGNPEKCYKHFKKCQ